MRYHLLAWLVALTLTIASPITALAIEYNYFPINYPGATATYATDINNTGQIVGWYTDSTGNHIFILSRRTFTSLNFPGAVSMGPGRSQDAGGGINDRGQVVGIYVDDASITHGYVYSDGVYTTLDYPPNDLCPDVTGTFLNAINNGGEIVGASQCGEPSTFTVTGFRYAGGIFTTVYSNYATGINNYGDIVSTSWYLGDVWVEFSCGGDGGGIFFVPTSGSTGSGKINDLCQFVGTYSDYEIGWRGYWTAPLDLDGLG